jgi:hypothetical protein
MTPSPSKSQGSVISTTAGALLAAEDAFTYLRACQLPASASFKVAVLLSKITAEFKVASDMRLDIFRSFGTEEGGQIRCPPDKLPQLTEALEPLAAEPVEIHARKLPFSIFEGLSISPAHMLALMPFIETEEEE